jgi:hypothetical protein
MTDIEKAIRTEICKALENLGGPSKLLTAIRDAPKEAMYDAAERLGATASCSIRYPRGATR